MNRRRIKFFLFLIFISFQVAVAQTENSLFWEVKGNELTTPSYLFGVSPMADKSFVQDLSFVMAKFESCGTYATEIILDSTMISKMRSASLMSDSLALEDIIGSESYQRTAEWFYQLTQNDLAIFKRYCPAAIQMLLLAGVHQNIFPGETEPLEFYFQREAKNKKKIIGLETIELLIDYFNGMGVTV